MSRCGLIKKWGKLHHIHVVGVVKLSRYPNSLHIIPGVAPDIFDISEAQVHFC